MVLMRSMKSRVEGLLDVVVNLQHVVLDHVLQGVGLLHPGELHRLADVLAHLRRVKRGSLCDLTSAMHMLMGPIAPLVQGKP